MQITHTPTHTHTHKQTTKKKTHSEIEDTRKTLISHNNHQNGELRMISRLLTVQNYMESSILSRGRLLGVMQDNMEDWVHTSETQMRMSDQSVIDKGMKT